MIELFVAGVVGMSVTQCKAEFPNDKFVEQLCKIPSITIQEVRETKHLQVACDALKAATEARGKKYTWVKLEFADGARSSCYKKGHQPK